MAGARDRLLRAARQNKKPEREFNLDDESMVEIFKPTNSNPIDDFEEEIEEVEEVEEVDETEEYIFEENNKNKRNPDISSLLAKIEAEEADNVKPLTNEDEVKFEEAIKEFDEIEEETQDEDEDEEAEEEIFEAETEKLEEELEIEDEINEEDEVEEEEEVKPGPKPGPRPGPKPGPKPNRVRKPGPKPGPKPKRQVKKEEVDMDEKDISFTNLEKTIALRLVENARDSGLTVMDLDESDLEDVWETILDLIEAV